MKISGFLILLFVLLSCSGMSEKAQKDQPKTAAHTTIEFDKESHNFGNLKAGEIVVYTFEFTNTGESDFMISSLECTCGCVNSNFIKEAVKPGEKGWIEIEFDTSGLAGREYKTIEVHGNSDELKHLAIFAEVKNELLEIKY